ncbi:MAG: phosphatase PAP2 family protein [Maribacter sp.]|nr:phosphatase PAP2 family protein [Maribacter sp.]
MKFYIVLSLFFIGLRVIAQAEDSPREMRIETGVEKVGDYGQFVPTAVSLITVLAKKDMKGFWQLGKSAATNFAVTEILKYSINKDRPQGATDAHAFPSGHTSFAFQGASFLQRRYGWNYGIPAYAVASFVAYSRLEGIHDRHDGWDVLAGALVGIGSTYLFTTPYEREHFALSYSGQDKNYLIGINYRL